ncbi:MAG: chromate transporter, partial [Acidimicrobiaceae bacterium]|nr:chromate transporter [Acidimicrobiaceae bacterium]
LGVAAAMGAVVPGIALEAARSLAGPSWMRAHSSGGSRWRWVLYSLAGATGALLAGPWLVVVILGAGAVEIVARTPPSARGLFTPLGIITGLGTVGGLGALVFEALKVGAFSYGGGFVIIPLMQHDTVVVHHWMTGVQFTNAVALGQITPGPVVQTVAVVGFAAAGYVGALVATFVAFTPSLLFVVVGGRYFARLRANARAQQFLTGAGASSIGAIAGSAVALATPLRHLWLVGLALLSLVWLVGLRRSTLSALLGAAVLGGLGALFGLPLPH